MKKAFATVLLSTMLATGLAGASFAAGPQPTQQGNASYGFQKQQRCGDELGAKLNLTPEQKEQAKKIREEGRAKMEPLKNQMKQLHEQAQAIRKENMDKFESILTPEQKTKFEAMKAERKAKFEQRKQKWGQNKEGF